MLDVCEFGFFIFEVYICLGEIWLDSNIVFYECVKKLVKYEEVGFLVWCKLFT